MIRYKRISVSLPIDLHKFMKNNGYNASKLLQGALINHEKEKNGELLESNSVLTRRLETLSNNLNNAMRFLEKKGVVDEFLEQKTD